MKVVIDSRPLIVTKIQYVRTPKGREYQATILDSAKLHTMKVRQGEGIEISAEIEFSIWHAIKSLLTGQPVQVSKDLQKTIYDESI